MQNLDQPNWQAESLRLTLFTLGMIPPGNHSWWTDVTGETPEREQTSHAAGIWQVEGQIRAAELGNPNLLLQIRGDRLDWILTADRSSSAMPFQSSGEFIPSLEWFLNVQHHWLDTWDLPVKRLALGANLVQPVPDKDTGYKRISTYLPFVIPPDASDFLYQINRPVDSSTAAGIRINRLARWSVMLFQQISIELSPHQLAIERDVASSEPFIACRLELDINSAPETPIFDLPLRSALAREFADMAIVIADRGEIV